MENGKTKKSKLVPIGVLLIIFGCFSRYLDNTAKAMTSCPIKAFVFLLTDVSRASAIIGIGVLILGLIRNSRLNSRK